MATSILGGAIHHAATRIQRVWRLVSWRRAFVAFSEQAKVSMESANGFMGEEHHLTDNDGMTWIFWTNLIFVAPDWYDFSTLVRHMSYDIWLTNIVIVYTLRLMYQNTEHWTILHHGRLLWDSKARIDRGEAFF